MDTPQSLITLGISLGLGLLVGLQRERKGEELAGIRTFALITVLGTIAAMTGKQMGTAWMVPLGAVGVAIVMAVGAYTKAQAKLELGLTTEFAALVMYLLGAYLVDGDRIAALVLGGAVVLLLYWKNVLHGFVQRMGDKDFSAIMQFVLIALVIWPVLPRERFGPYGFFNPFETWLVVVLVVGMSLGGYVLYKLVPPTTGAIVGGAVGGMISSTATTVSYARRASNERGATAVAVQAIMTANAVSVLRVIALLALFAPAQAGHLLPPLGVMACVLGAMTWVVWFLERRDAVELADQENPTEIKAAVIFAVIYTTVKLATTWGKDVFGPAALFVIAAISGLTDVDAITLSMSESARNQSVQDNVVWRVVLVAILANLVFKGGCVMVLGSMRLRKWIALLFGVALAAGAGILYFWPNP